MAFFAANGEVYVTGGDGSNKLWLTSEWKGKPDADPKASEISNDTKNYKSLMLVGNKSNDGRLD